MRAAVDLAGYTMSESDELRKAISKKQKDKLMKHQEKFIQGAVDRGMSQETAEAIFTDWEEFARYGFNKCLPGSVEVVDAGTGRLVRLEDLYNGSAHLAETITCDTSQLQLKAGRIARVMENGVKPVFRLKTASGRSIDATGNHPFYTASGWQRLDRLKPGDAIATPRRIPVEGQHELPEHELIALGDRLAENCLCHPQSSDYEIPPQAFELTNRQLSLLAGRLWQAGGHVDMHNRCIFYTTSSERLAHQIQHILLRLDTLNSLRSTHTHSDGRPVYQLFVTGAGDLARFSATVGQHFTDREQLSALHALVREASLSPAVTPLQITPVSHPAGLLVESHLAPTRRSGAGPLSRSSHIHTSRRKAISTGTGSKGSNRWARCKRTTWKCRERTTLLRMTFLFTTATPRTMELFPSRRHI